MWWVGVKDLLTQIYEFYKACLRNGLLKGLEKQLLTLNAKP